VRVERLDDGLEHRRARSALRLSRRIRPASTGPGAIGPLRISSASRTSSAAFSSCIRRWRRSARISSSPSSARELAEFVDGVAGVVLARGSLGDQRALPGDGGIGLDQRGVGIAQPPTSPSWPPKGIEQRAVRGDRPAPGRRAGREFRRPASRWPAAGRRTPAGR
jgi:hypothetical protein